MRAPLTVAVAQPRCSPKNVRSNAIEHAGAVRRAKARLVVFPELSLTGYELDAEPVSPDDDALTAIVRACADNETIALVGAPVANDRGRVYIGTLRIDGGGATVAYRKSYPSDDERRRFSPGNGAVAVEVDGWRVGIGICRDMGVEQHVRQTAALDVDLYVAGVVHGPEELEVQEDRAARIARACEAYVVLASFAGPTGEGFDRTAGTSSIWAADGTPIARARAEPGEVVSASLA